MLHMGWISGIITFRRQVVHQSLEHSAPQGGECGSRLGTYYVFRLAWARRWIEIYFISSPLLKGTFLAHPHLGSPVTFVTS